MIIKSAWTYTANCEFKKKDIVIQNGYISELKDEVETSERSGQVIDAKGLYAIPGLIDLHFHGCRGDDFCDADKNAIARIAAYEASIGVSLGAEDRYGSIAVGRKKADIVLLDENLALNVVIKDGMIL